MSLTTGDDAREQLLAAMPVTEQRLDLAGVSTAVLQAGQGPPVVLLHGPGAYGAAWLPIVPALATSHRVIAPDLPGQGASTVAGGPPDASQVLAWLAELLERTCPSPPVLVGQLLGGAIAARFAVDHPDRISRLVLVVPFGLAAFEPTPAFGAAMMGFLTRPTEDSHEALWRHCVYDLDRLRDQLGGRWKSMTAYNLDLARTASVADAQRTLMEQFGMPAIPPEQLARISVPTTLIWGRQDSIVRLPIAQGASKRYGWPLHVIDDAGNEPAMEAPDAFVRALDTV
jgi:pimeloyl-ACP methyl ester carboxylesterase